MSQPLFGDGLEEVVDGGELEGAKRVLVVGCGEDDGGARRREGSRHLQAVHLGHLDVEEDEIR